MNKSVSLGDIVRLRNGDSTLGIVVFRHPTKSVARIRWLDVGNSWDKCSRLEVVSSAVKTSS